MKITLERVIIVVLFALSFYIAKVKLDCITKKLDEAEVRQSVQYVVTFEEFERVYQTINQKCRK